MKYIFVSFFLIFFSSLFSQESIKVSEIQVPENVGYIKEKNQYAFEVKTTKKVKKISIEVFSRWGNLVVKSNELLVLWPKSNESPGLYYVKVTGVWDDNSAFEEIKSINFY